MRILIIEDDVKLCESLSYQLTQEGYSVDVCHEGDDGLRWIFEYAHDIILLDRMMPRMNGIQVLKKTRAAGISTPILLITALGELGDKITGLDSGADDYIVKPFAFEELLARIRSIIRRPRQWEGTPKLNFGDISFQPIEKQLYHEEKNCTLSKRESDLLEMFLRNPSQILPRSVLLSRVWGPDAEVEDGNLDNYIHLLRRRLKSVGSTLVLKTIRSVGYCLEASND